MGLDIICLGESMLEFNQVEKDGAQYYLPGYGGDTSNCAVAAARQGVRVGYITAVGADSFGVSFQQFWQKENIDTSCIKTNPEAPTGIYFVTHSQSGHEFFYYRKGSAASLIKPQDIPESYIRNTKILHVSGISQAISEQACETVIYAMQIAKRNGVKVSYDTNLRLRLWKLERAREVIHEAISHADIALPSLDDSMQLTGVKDADQIADFYLNLGVPLVALKLGEQGCLVATKNERRKIASYKVKSIDATGAGDTFDGAFLTRLIEGDDPFSAARYANAAAAISTTGYGAIAPIPQKNQVLEFLKSSNI
jgi:2-dehydro-3-deoxygluconokinase